MSPEQQAKNAIQWIDALPGYKQAPKGGRGILGDKGSGFCCLGAACYELDVDYSPHRGISFFLQHNVGLLNVTGAFSSPNSVFWGVNSLICMNDSTRAGFKRIAKLMKTKPHWMFTPEVAALIKAHYEGGAK